MLRLGASELHRVAAGIEGGWWGAALAFFCLEREIILVNQKLRSLL